MDGGSVAGIVAKHPNGLRNERELGKIALQLLNGLHYLHKSHHQVHRDLKPANVLLNHAGESRVAFERVQHAYTLAGTTAAVAHAAPFGCHMPQAPSRSPTLASHRRSASPLIKHSSLPPLAT